MAKEIVSFRITPEASARLEKLKEQLKQTSTEVLNAIIMSNGVDNSNNEKPRLRTIPEDALKDYFREPDILDYIKTHSLPFCGISIKRHAEARKIIQNEGMDYFYFSVDDDMSMAIIAANKEEASMQFQKYYSYDKEAGRYVRTSHLLPQYRYDPSNTTVIILEYE